MQPLGQLYLGRFARSLNAQRKPCTPQLSSLPFHSPPARLYHDYGDSSSSDLGNHQPQPPGFSLQTRRFHDRQAESSSPPDNQQNDRASSSDGLVTDVFRDKNDLVKRIYSETVNPSFEPNKPRTQSSPEAFGRPHNLNKWYSDFPKRQPHSSSRYAYGWGLEDRHWYKNLRLLESIRRRMIPNEEKWKSLDTVDWETAASWAGNITRSADKLSSYHFAWQKVPLNERREQWPNIVMWLLLNSPEKALLFLRATDRTPRPSFKALARAYLYLARLYPDIVAASESARAQFRRYVTYSLGPSKWSSDHLWTGGLRLYLETRRPGELGPTYDKMVPHHMYMNAKLFLFFVDRFIHVGDVDRALQALEGALRKPKFENRKLDAIVFTEIERRAVRVLTLDEIVEENGVCHFSVLHALLKIGFRMNRNLYNVMIQNCFRIGDPSMAWEILDFMKLQGCKPTAFTYIPFLEDAIQRRDIESIELILRDAIVSCTNYKIGYLVSKGLHAIATFALDNPDATLSERIAMFNDMVALYRQFFDDTPLIELGLVEFDKQREEEKKHLKIPPAPQPHNLVIMISAFVRSQTDPLVVRHTFERFQQLVSQGHKDLAPLVESDHIYNAFLMGMREHPSLLSDCIRLVGDMLEPPKPIVLNRGPPQQLHPTHPTVRTWTILIGTFLAHGQPQTAAKIRELMLKNGCRFNDHTWNVMIGGFAKLQMAEETAASLIMSYKEGFPPNRVTAGAAKKLYNKKDLRNALNQLAVSEGINLGALSGGPLSELWSGANYDVSDWLTDSEIYGTPPQFSQDINTEDKVEEAFTEPLQDINTEDKIDVIPPESSLAIDINWVNSLTLNAPPNDENDAGNRQETPKKATFNPRQPAPEADQNNGIDGIALPSKKNGGNDSFL